MALSKSIFRIQSDLSTIVKDAHNENTESDYASLRRVLEKLNPLLIEEKLVLTQFTQYLDVNAGWVLTTEVMSDDGTNTKTTHTPLLGLTEGSNKMQALGSAITYARRYGLISLFKLAPIDDDGNGVGITSEPSLQFVKGKKNEETKPSSKGQVISAKEFKVGDGKYKGKKITDIPKKELSAYIEEIEKATSAAGKKHPKWFLDLKQAAIL